MLGEPRSIGERSNGFGNRNTDSEGANTIWGQMKPYYQDSAVTIYHGDCSQTLAGLAFDAVVTDPPYGLNFKNSSWDYEIPAIAFQIAQWGNAIIITAPLRLWDYPKPKWVLNWYRPASSSRSASGGFNHWSPILVYRDCKFPVDSINLHAIEHSYPVGFEHPSPKPEELMRWLVQHGTEETETILDPFMGSGTTLRAAKDLGRKAIGIEIEEKYCEIAAKRMAQEVLAF